MTEVEFTNRRAPVEIVAIFGLLGLFVMLAGLGALVLILAGRASQHEVAGAIVSALMFLVGLRGVLRLLRLRTVVVRVEPERVRVGLRWLGLMRWHHDLPRAGTSVAVREQRLVVLQHGSEVVEVIGHAEPGAATESARRLADALA